MKKVLSLILVVAMLCTACIAFASCGKKDDGKKTAAFVTFGVAGNDFFQALADTFVAKFKAAGWEATYADGQYNPATQVTATENYIAQGVDLLYIWAVDAGAVSNVIAQARQRGIKVVAFVCPLEEYDALMVSEDKDLADDAAKFAAKWIDETYADAADDSVNVAVFSCRAANTGVVQADELLKIAEFSKKAGNVTEVECSGETLAIGQEKMENFYSTHQDYKVFLTAHSGLGNGINAFFTSESSPVKNYEGYGIFTINGTSADAEVIAADNTPYRGTVMTGSVADTVDEMMYVGFGLLDGSVQQGHIQKAGTIFINKTTATEFLSTGKVTSFTKADLED